VFAGKDAGAPRYRTAFRHQPKVDLRRAKWNANEVSNVLEIALQRRFVFVRL
jgi:hypothetical protein